MLLLGNAALLKEVLFKGTNVQFIFTDGTTCEQHCGLMEDNVRLYFKARSAILDAKQTPSKK